MKQPLYVIDEVPLNCEILAMNRVRAVTGIAQPTQPNRNTPTLFQKYYCEYDRHGNQTILELSSSQGLSRTGVFDACGNLTKLSYRNQRGQEEYAFEYAYNGSQILIEKRMVSHGKIMHRFVTEEIQDGLLLSTVCIDANEKLLRKDRYHYQDGKLVRIDMGHLGEWYFDYNEKDQLIAKIGALASHGPDEENYTFAYSENGLLLRMDRLNQDFVEVEYLFWDS